MAKSKGGVFYRTYEAVMCFCKSKKQEELPDLLAVWWKTYFSLVSFEANDNRRRIACSLKIMFSIYSWPKK